MIAPLRTKKRPPASPRMRAARAMIAAMLLPNTVAAPPVAAWKAWLFVAWISITLAAYGLSTAESLLRFVSDG